MDLFKQVLLTPLLEATATGDVWKVMIIEEGLSKNGKYYSEEVLREAAHLFENSKVNFYEWKGGEFNHLPMAIENIRPEGFPLQTAGVLKNIKFETTKNQGREVRGLTAKLHFLQSSKINQLKSLLASAWNKGLKNLLGLSINAEGSQLMKMLNGVPVQIVQAIKRVFSTDLVTQPAAGGSLLSLIESINNQEGGELQMFKKLLAALKKKYSKMFEAVDVQNISEEELIGILESAIKGGEKSLESITLLTKAKKFEEASKLIEEEKVEDPKPEPKVEDPKPEPKVEDAVKEGLAAIDAKEKALDAKMAKQDEKLALNESKEILSEMLHASKLPIPVRAKIKSRFADRVFEAAELKADIKLERDTLAKLVESENLDFGDLGEGSFELRTPTDKLQASLDLMIGYEPKDDEKEQYDGIDAFSGLKEAYVAYTDDPTITGQMGPAAISRLQEAAATSNSFSYALGYTINRKMLPEYQKIPELWREIATTTPVKDFKMQERIRWGGFGILPEVQAARTSQGTPVDSASISYTELGFPADEEATYAIGTKGGKVTLTRRMIINDDLKVLRAIPKKLGSAAAHTLNQFVFDLMLGMSSGTINGASMYDSVALYATDHRNYRTTALGYDNLSSLVQDMWFQVETGATTTANDGTLAESDTTFTVTNGAIFKAGDMCLCEGELMRITSVATHDLTVARGQYGTTDTSHADAKTVYLVTRFLGLDQPKLWVPRSLYSTAMQLRDSVLNPENAENGVNTLKGQFNLMSPCPYLQGDENNYFLSSPVDKLAGIEMGFLNGKEAPELFVQDNPVVGTVFTADTITYKVRHEYGGCVTDYRPFAASIVA